MFDSTYHFQYFNIFDLFQCELNPLEQIRSLFINSVKGSAEETLNKGCFIQNAGAELYRKCDATTAFIDQNTEILKTKFFSKIEEISYQTVK